MGSCGRRGGGGGRGGEVEDKREGCERSGDGDGAREERGVGGGRAMVYQGDGGRGGRRGDGRGGGKKGGGLKD